MYIYVHFKVVTPFIVLKGQKSKSYLSDSFLENYFHFV